MLIKILGVGCSRCKKLEQQVRDIVASNNIPAEIEKVTDVQDMMKYGIMATPGLVINEKLKSSGLTLKDEQILNWIKEEIN
ncbi:MAG: thioredoxin family protein [Ignavibacteriae bacterium]|nr:thioredoxin family protein [Ignavibacteriota bacterium]